jgi:cell division protein FtsX
MDKQSSSVTSYLHDLPGYSNLFIRETINLEEINEMIDRNLAVFSVIFVIVIFAILLVMSTTMMVYFEEKKKMVAIIDLLGGRSVFILWCHST